MSKIELCDKCYSEKGFTNILSCERCKSETNQPHTELDDSALDDIVHDALGEVFCDDCEHPRCLNKVKLYKRAIIDWHNKQVEEIIGEDEGYEGTTMNWAIEHRNNLRAEQRNKLKENTNE